MDVIRQVFVIFAAGVAAGELFARLRLPRITGELLAGTLLGPHMIGWIHLNRTAETLASLGVVVLLFTAGLEMRVSELTEVGVPALVSSAAGVAVTVGGAFGAILAFGHHAGAAVLAAIALAATSAGIGTRVFSDLGILQRRAGRVMMGAAVIDDVLILIVLSVALTAGSSKSAGSIVVSLLFAIVFIALVAVVGPRVARRHASRFAPDETRKAAIVPAMALCLGLAALAEQVGLAALVGAFLAGMILAETREQFPLEHGMRPLADFLVPFFFVVAGARVDLHALAGPGLPLAIVVSAVAIAAKFAGCALGAIGLRPRERWLVGAGMIARGEVTLAAATVALVAGRIPQSIFSAVLTAVFISAFAGAIAVRALAGGSEEAASA